MEAIPHSNIYTRSGDDGTTSLYTGERRPKHDPIFVALGDIDELNSVIGQAAHECEVVNNGLVPTLRSIQCCLLEIGSHIATPRNSNSEAKIHATAFDTEGKKIKSIEDTIDSLDAQLPPLKNFILPFGGRSSGFLHQARAVCRRSERAVCLLSDMSACDSDVLRYVNRLSDFFFVAARFAAQWEGIEEVSFQSTRGPALNRPAAPVPDAHPLSSPFRLSLGLAALAVVSLLSSKLRAS